MGVLDWLPWKRKKVSGVEAVRAAVDKQTETLRALTEKMDYAFQRMAVQDYNRVESGGDRHDKR